MRAKKTLVPPEENNWCARGNRFVAVERKYLVQAKKKILYGVRKRFVATEGKDLVWCKDNIWWFKQGKTIGEELMSNPDCFWVGN